MITFILIIFSTFAVHSNEVVDCNHTADLTPLTQKNTANISQLNSLGHLSLSEKQKAFDKSNSDDALLFLNSLPDDKKKVLTEVIDKIKNTHISLVTLRESGTGDPVLIVNGLDFKELPHEWFKPLGYMMEKDQPSYFYKWKKSDSLEKSRDQLNEIIKELLLKNKDKKLEIIAYSAGGVIALLSLDQLAYEKKAERISLNTVAAPLFGYGAPSIAMIAAPFVGKGAIQIGRGNHEKLNHKTLNNCVHWVTLNCEMDKHACDVKNINPQMGSSKKQLPCSKIIKIDAESHSSVLNRAIQEILK